MKELNIEIKIEEINVTEDWYDIHYKYRMNQKFWQSGILDGDYENGDTPKQWKKTLEKGLAMEYVLQKIAEEILEY